MPAGGSARSRTAVLPALLAFLAVLLLAHSPLLRAGLFAWDYRALLTQSSWSLLAFSRPTGLPAPGHDAVLWRLESLLLLVGLALAARAFLVRLLEPRLGVQAARAAALVAALLAPLHPAAPAAIAELAGRGEVVGLLLGFSAGALFLHGRQQEREGLTAVSLVVLVLAGCASSVAVLLGLGFGAAEFASVRRHRPRSLRLRTSATTAAIFGLGAALPLLLGERESSAAAVATLSFGEELRERILGLAGELGRVATLPGDTPPGDGLGAFAVLFAGVLLLLALQPAFRAARNAPRLWGGILVSWSVVLFAALAWAQSGGQGQHLLALLVWSSGLGLTLTVLARPWRAVLTTTLALGWAILAHAGARPWLAGSAALARLHGEIAALALPAEARVFVLDPPVLAGMPPLGTDLGWLFHPTLHSGALDPTTLDHGADESAFDPRRVQGLMSAAFLALTRSAAFESLRQGELVVLSPGDDSGGAPAGLQVARLPAVRAAGTPPTSWRGALKFVPDAPLDPLRIELVRIVAELTTAPREIERLAWRTPAAETARADSGSSPGFVSERNGRRVAEFDLSSSLAWRLAGSVAALLVKNGVREIERGELLARLPELTGLGPPEVTGGDWWFTEPKLEGERERGAHYVLGLLALDDFERLQLPLEPDARVAGGLLARGAQRFVARKARAGAPIAWELEYRVGEHAFQRSRGQFP